MTTKSLLCIDGKCLREHAKIAKTAFLFLFLMTTKSLHGVDGKCLRKHAWNMRADIHSDNKSFTFNLDL